MADLRGTYKSPKGSPYFDYDVSYTETSRNGSSAKYRVNLRVRMTSSYSKYGYGIRAYVSINGAKSEKQIKSAGGMWSGSGWQGTWSFDVTASAGTGGGTLPAEVKIWGTDGGSAPNMTIGGKTVSLSTWNTAPYWTSDDGNINGWKEHKIIPENAGIVTVNLPKATDKEGNRIYYDVYRYVNGSSNAKILSGGNGSPINDNISSFGQGTEIKYKFCCHDGSLWAPDHWSWKYTKNILTPANVSIPSSINFDSGSLQINLSGQANTDGNTSFTFGISSNNFPVYNADSVKGSTAIVIYKSGNLPTTPYIKFEDIKNFVRSNGWRGVATINVETRNAYGSKATMSATVNIDLRTNPTTVASINVGGQTTVAGGKYFIPSRGSFSVNWSGASDKLGGSISYDLQGAYAGGDWITLKANLSGTSTQINLEAVTQAINYRFRVIAKTNFGYSSYSGESVITLHYYNQPKITIRNVNRSATQYSAEVYTQTDTSITAVAINMRQWQDKNGAFHNFAGSPYRFTQDGLWEGESYTKQVKCSDNSGLPESTVTLNYQVNSYVPIVSIRKKGLGINALANDVNKLNVNGRARAYAFVSEGYETNNPAGDHVNQWVKVASFRITNRYGDACATIDFLDSGSGSCNPVSGRLRCRVKQQDEFTKPTALGLFLENPVSCSIDDFYLVVTKNVVGEVIGELWYRCSVGWTSVYFYPSQVLGDVTMYARQPFQGGLPAGQNIKASYSPMNTPIGMNAMGSANKNTYWGLATPDGNDETWIRTTKNGIIPWSSGQNGSLGTPSWKFDQAHIGTVFEGGQRLDEKYIPRTGGNVNGRLDLGNDGKRLTMGIGDYDVAIGNTKTGKWLQLKDDGRLCHSGKEILDTGHFSTDRSLNGYQYLPNGLLMQWGYVSMGKDATKLINLKKSFADNNYNLQVSTYGGPGRVPATKTYYINKNNFYVQCEAGFNVYWFAIGAV